MIIQMITNYIVCIMQRIMVKFKVSYSIHTLIWNQAFPQYKITTGKESDQSWMLSKESDFVLIVITAIITSTGFISYGPISSSRKYHFLSHGML